MSRPRACPKCLQRSWLLALLAREIERAHRGGADLAWLLCLEDDALVDALAPEQSHRLLGRIRALGRRPLAVELERASCWATCRHDDLYPAALLGCPDAPDALIGRGDPDRLAGLRQAHTVTVVGARRATPRGREIARALSRDLAEAGAGVVSGLSFGIDACAHQGALDAGGRTVAVLPGGPDTAYPAAHRSLLRRITERGLVLSELPPGSVPWRWTFVARDRIMAGLAAMTVVVEAHAGSSSVATAATAADLGRQVGAVPGQPDAPTSVGTDQLLAAGAVAVGGAGDVLDALRAGRCGRPPRHGGGTGADRNGDRPG